MQRQTETDSVSNNFHLAFFLQFPNDLKFILASIQPVTPHKTAEDDDRIMDISCIQTNSTNISTSAESCAMSSNSISINEFKSFLKK